MLITTIIFALTKFGAIIFSDYVTFINPPAVVKDLLTFDKTKLFFNRFICS